MGNRISDNEAGNSLITKDSPMIIAFLASLDHMLEGLGKMRSESRPMLNGERFLSDKELSERLNISRRALQEYRHDGKIAYYQIGAKILYKESDVKKMLEANYREAYK